jgi:hypothetical protein
MGSLIRLLGAILAGVVCYEVLEHMPILNFMSLWIAILFTFAMATYLMSK